MSGIGISAVIQYRDPDLAAQWLQDVLGLSLVERADGDDGRAEYIKLQYGSSTVIACLSGTTPLDAHLVHPQDTNRLSTQTCYITVDDLQKTYDRCCDSSVDLLSELLESDDDTRFFLCRDPEGHLWCIGTAPSSKPDSSVAVHQTDSAPASSASSGSRARQLLAVLLVIAGLGLGLMYYRAQDVIVATGSPQWALTTGSTVANVDGKLRQLESEFAETKVALSQSASDLRVERDRSRELQSSVTRLNTELDQLRSDENQRTAHEKTLATKLMNLEAERTSLVTERQSAKRLLDAARAKNDRLIAQLQSAELRAQNLKSKLNTISDGHASALAQKDQEIETSKASLARVAAGEANAKTELQTARRRVRQLRASIASATSQLETTRKQKALLKATIADMQSEAEALRRRAADHAKALASATLTTDKTKNEKMVAIEQLSLARQKVEALDASLTKLRQQIDKRRARRSRNNLKRDRRKASRLKRRRSQKRTSRQAVRKPAAQTVSPLSSALFDCDAFSVVCEQ